MDAWQRTFDQLRALLRGLSAAQKVSLLVVSLGVLAGMGWLVWSSAKPSDEFLLGGKSFTADELKETQAALKGAGLTQFKVVGQRISVPVREADRYTAAAIARQTLPAQFAAEFDRMQSKVNLFTSSEQRRELLEEARKSRLAQILRSIPEIEEAIVEWDRPRQANLFRPAPQVAAHVSVKPREGRELSPELVQSLKLFVAGALAGAQADDVTVVDMNTSRVYGRRSAADAATERVQALAKQHEQEYSAQIARALSHIPDVMVTVNVRLVAEEEVDDSAASFVSSRVIPASRLPRETTGMRRSRTGVSPFPGNEHLSVVRAVRGFNLGRAESNLDQESDAAASTSDVEHVGRHRHTVQVAVSVPESYLAAIAQARGIRPGRSLVQDSAFRAALVDIKAETQREVREKLVRLLPPDSEPNSISVSTYTPLKVATEKSESPPMAVSDLPFGVDLTQWKMGAGLVLCGICLSGVLFWSRRAGHTLAAPPQTSEVIVDEPAPGAESAAVPADAYPVVDSHPHAAVLEELAELERRAPMAHPQGETPFAFLADLAVWDAARLLESEHPQTIALVATALVPAQAAAIVHSLPDSLRWDVTQRLTRIGPAAPDVLCEVAASLKSRLHARPMSSGTNWRDLSGQSRVNTDHSPVGGTSPMAHQKDLHAPAPDVSSCPLAFDDLRLFDMRSLATVLESVDLRAFAVALLDRSESFKQALFAVMPRHVAAAIRQHLRQLGPVRLIEINASQQAIAGVAWNLAQNGIIALPAQ